jgi:hypothetical protein
LLSMSRPIAKRRRSRPAARGRTVDDADATAAAVAPNALNRQLRQLNQPNQ